MLAVLLMGNLFVCAQGRIDLGRTQSAQECVNYSKDGFTATFSFSGVEATEVDTEKGVFSILTMDGTYPAGNLGEPSLPAAHQLIAVPYGAQHVTVEVKGFNTTTYRLSDYGIKTVMPQQPSVRKDQKPEDMKLVYSEKAYAVKSFSQRPLATLEVQGTMRGIQVGSLTVNPVNYNPADNTIEVYNDIEVEVHFNDYDKVAAEDEFVRTFNPYFASVYKTMFNHRQIMSVYDDHPDLWQAPVKMLVIANRMFETVIQDWIAWKTTKGFYMDVNYTDQIGSTASAIRSFIQSKYAQEAPTFVIVFGDTGQVPASATGDATTKVTDLQYMTVDSDDYPDVYYSRMSAENTSQMTNIISKVMQYEQYTMPDPSYLNNVLLIAGWDSYWTSYVGKPTIQYAMQYYYNAAHGFSNVYNWLGQPYTDCYVPLSSGVGFANYTAHGSETAWANPSLSVSDVNNLTNTNKPFLAMGNCCLTGNFGYSSTCFGEALIRANNKAAYSYIGSCPETYWYEDYYFGVGATNVFSQMPTYSQTAYGTYDAIWDDDVFNTVSAIPFIGNIAVCYAHAGSYQGSVNNRYYWQAYHVLGDGSVMPFRVQPTQNTVSHNSTFTIGSSTFQVNAAAGSYVALSKDGVLLGVGLVDQTGSITLNVDPVTTSGNVTVCVTHPQHIPYLQTIPAVALNGPYVVVDSYTPTSAHVGTTTSMSITFKNVGTSATGGTTTVNLSCSDQGLTIINGTKTFSNLSSGATTQVNGFTYSIAQGVADETQFTIHTTATCGNNTWNGTIKVTATEAVLEFQEMVWAGAFDPGETFPVTAVFKNTGHYNATNAVATIASTSSYVSFTNSSVTVGTIEPDAEATCQFNVTVSASCPVTEVIPLTFTLNADGGITAQGAGALSNSCDLVFELHDSYGDGWNGASLGVAFSDGSPSQNLTIQSGSQAVYTCAVTTGTHVTLSWTSGSWDSECSFIVKYENGDNIFEGSNLNGGFSYEFDVDCSSMLTYTISATANPNVGGTVSGAGSYASGVTCTLTATPNSGYTFTNWTKNGTQVSTNATYSFTVTENAEYVAYFTSVASLSVLAEYYPDANNSSSPYVKVSWAEIVSTFTVDFDDSQVPAGWTTLDGGSPSGYGWQIGSTKLNGTGYGHNGSTDLMLSQSYDNNYGVVYPDNWLISPAVTLGTNSQFSLWACGQDASYVAEHFGVFVSTTGTNPSDFTMVGEWTLTAKGQGAPTKVTRSGNRAQGNWYQYTVDLGSYAGSGRYIAVRHFNCSNMFYLDVDDLVLSNGAKSLTITDNDADNVMEGMTESSSSTLYDIYRAACDGTGSTLIANNVTGNEYIDNGWSNLTAGNYKFGVGVMGSTNIVWSNCIEKIATTDITQSTHFNNGWTWWSTCIEQPEGNGLVQLEQGLGNSGLIIKKQTASLTNVGGDWYGTLDALDNASSYRIKTNAEVDVDITGPAVVTASHPVTLLPSWTWIGYPCTAAMSIDEAMSGITPTDMDVLKTQSGSATYMYGGWYGTLGTLTPGMGLMYKSNSSGNITLTFPNGAKGEGIPELDPVSTHWAANYTAYPDNMTVMAVVELDDNELQSESYELATFANGECRGSVRLLYVEPIQRYIAFLTVTGDEAAELRFGLYDAETGEEYHNATETLTYESNAVVGNLDVPMVVHFRGNTGLDDLNNRIQVFPNPVDKGQTFNIGLANGEISEAQVEIIDALGVVVETVCTPSLQAPNVPGVYTLRITAEGQGTCYKKLIVR